MPTQSKIGWRPYVNPSITASSLWNSIYSVYNADTVGSSSLKTSLVAAYNGESNTNDSFGTNNGTAQGGLTYTTGKIGDAFNFNGTNAYVGIPNTSGQLDFTGDFSISTWVMPLVTSAAYNTYFSNYKTGGAYGSGYVLYLDRSSNKLKFQIGAQASYAEYFYSWIPLVNTWYHLTVTRKKSTGTKFYINGVEVIGQYTGIGGTATLDQTYQTGQIYNIGSSLNGSSLGNYRQDAVNVWNKELTSTEVTELYNSGNGAQYIGDNFYKPTTNDALLVNNGTAQGGLTYGLGKVGTAFQFNGSNAYVALPDNAFNSLNGSFSVSAWFKTASSISNVDNFILDNISANAWFNNPNGFYVEQYGNVLNFTIFNNTNTYTELGANYTFSTNTWYHVTATKLVNGNMNLYLNGSLVGTKVTSVNPTYLATVSKPCIGALNIPARGSVGYFAQNGFMVDALNIWNKELTQADVTELYNSGNGKQYVSSLDSDAQAFIASAAITVTTQQTAINTLVTDLKAANIWTKMKAIYPFVGGTATQHRFNLKSPGTTAADFYLDFIGGGIHNANGYQPNGTTAYADTKLIPSTSLTLNSTHLSVYLTTAGGGGDYFDMGVEDNSYNNRLFMKVHGSGIQIMNNSYLIDYAEAAFSNSTIVGHYINNRTSSNVINSFKNNTKVLNDTAKISQGLSVRPLYIAAHNFAGSPSFLSPRRQAFASIGNGLTDAEALAFYTAVQKYQTTLGRQV